IPLDGWFEEAHSYVARFDRFEVERGASVVVVLRVAVPPVPGKDDETLALRPARAVERSLDDGSSARVVNSHAAQQMTLFDAMGFAEIHGDPIAFLADAVGRPHGEWVAVGDGRKALGRYTRAEPPTARRQPAAGEVRRFEMVEDDVGSGFGTAVAAV